MRLELKGRVRPMSVLPGGVARFSCSNTVLYCTLKRPCLEVIKREGTKDGLGHSQSSTHAYADDANDLLSTKPIAVVGLVSTWGAILLSTVPRSVLVVLWLSGAEGLVSQRRSHPFHMGASSSAKQAAIIEDAEDQPPLDEFVAAMSLDQKLGQLFQVDWRSLRSPPLVDVLPLSWAQPMLSQVSSSKPLKEDNVPVKSAITDGYLGSVLGGGGAHPDPNAPHAWREQAEALQRAAIRSSLQLPLLIANDSVHGHANLRGATLFQHHIGQGCMRNAKGEPDVDLVEQLAALSARESYACGINWLFSPCLAVPRDLRWGRTYEGFSEDPTVVGMLGAAEVRGIQQTGGVPVIGCAKHWVGDGGTEFGTGGDDFAWTGAPTRILDQGDTKVSARELREVHMAPYLPSLAEDVHSVMVSYSSVNGIQMHAHRYLITDVLKGELQYPGIVISDFDALPRLRSGCLASAPGQGGVDAPAVLDGADASVTVPPLQRAGTLGFAEAACASLNSGVDMIMTSGGMFGGASLASQIAAVKKLVVQGRVPMERIDDAVRRVVRVKRLLLEREQAEADGGMAALNVNACVGCAAHRAIARRAASQSAVLLINKDGLLPLKSTPAPERGSAGAAGAAVIVTGAGANDLGAQCGGWSGEWQGMRGNAWTDGGTTLWEAIRAEAGDGAELHTDASQALAAVRSAMGHTAAPIAIVVGGEPPYAEGGGDTRDAGLSAADRSLVHDLNDAGARVVLLLLCGRPIHIPQTTLARVSALVACWLPGTEGGGVADVLFGRVHFSGKLSFSWPRDGTQARHERRQGESDPLFSRGFGLETRTDYVESDVVTLQ